MAKLSEYLFKSSKTPFVWGENDCGLWVLNYVQSVTGVDVTSAHRGRYDTALGCQRYLKEHNGVLGLSCEVMAQFEDGDEVGVYDLNGTDVAGIKINNRVAFKSDDGIFVTEAAKLIKGWNICPN